MQYLDVVPLRRVPWGLREFTYSVGCSGALVGDLVWCRFGGHRTAAVAWQERPSPPDGVAAQPLQGVARAAWTTPPQRQLLDRIAGHYATPLPTLLYRYGVVPPSRKLRADDAPALRLPPAVRTLADASLLEAPPADLVAATCQLAATLAVGGPVLVLCPTRRDVEALAAASGAASYDLDDSRTARSATWAAVLDGRAKIVVGTAASAFLPFPALAGVIVYREGDPAAKAVEARPLHHLRTLGQMLCTAYGCRMAVADWAPSPAAAAWAAAAGRLVRRPAPLYSSNVTLATPPLLRSHKFAAAARMASPSGRLLIIVPRLGEGGLLRCADCRTVPSCPNCERSLPVASGARLRCSFCGHAEPVPARCAKCGGARLQAKQATVATVARQLRTARGREDVGEVAAGSSVGMDEPVVVSSTAALYQLDLSAFSHRIALDFDTLLRQPTLEAAPRAYRVARELAAAGPTTVETSQPEHPCFVNLDRWDSFVARELADRRRFSLPPAAPVVKLSYDAPSRSEVERAGDSQVYRLGKAGILAAASYPSPGRSPTRRFRWVILVPGLEPPAGVDYSHWTIDPDPTDLA